MGFETIIISPEDFKRSFAMPGYSEIKLTLGPHKQLKTMIEATNDPFIHIATEGPLGCAARKYCIKHGRPFTTTYHTHFPDYVVKRLPRWFSYLARPIKHLTIALLRRFHAPAAMMSVATPSLKETLQSWNFKTPMINMTRGVPLDLFHPGPSPQCKDIPKPIALYVGRVAVEKNIDAFLDMEWHGSKVIVGDGPSLQFYKDAYPHITFAGKQTGQALADHYRAADIFVFPSKTDTFGMVIIEALACGLPVAAYDVTGPRDIITHDFLGNIQTRDLALAAKNALTCPGTKEQRSEHVKKHYTWKQAAKEFLTLAQTKTQP